MGEMTNNKTFGTDGAAKLDGNKLSVSFDRGQDVAQHAKDVASTVANQAKGLASQVATQAKDMVTSQVSEQQEKSAGELGAVAKALRQTSKELDGNMASPYVEQAAEGVEKVSEFLRTTNVKEIAGTVERFARREPLLFLGGTFALGILGARFLKSSSHHMEAAASTTPTLPGGFKPQQQGVRKMNAGNMGRP